MSSEDPKKADKEIQKMDQEDKNEILEHFSTFKDYLGDQVRKGEKLNLSEKGLAQGAKRVSDYLNKHEEPKNREEKVLHELWNETENDEEKDTFARLLVRLAQQTNEEK